MNFYDPAIQKKLAQYDLTPEEAERYYRAMQEAEKEKARTPANSQKDQKVYLPYVAQSKPKGSTEGEKASTTTKPWRESGTSTKPWREEYVVYTPITPWGQQTASQSGELRDGEYVLPKSVYDEIVYKERAYLMSEITDGRARPDTPMPAGRSWRESSAAPAATSYERSAPIATEQRNANKPAQQSAKTSQPQNTYLPYVAQDNTWRNNNNTEPSVWRAPLAQPTLSTQFRYPNIYPEWFPDHYRSPYTMHKKEYLLDRYDLPIWMYPHNR